MINNKNQRSLIKTHSINIIGLLKKYAYRYCHTQLNLKE